MSLEQFNQVPRKEEVNRKEERLLQEVKTWTKKELSGLKAEILVLQMKNKKDIP